MGRDPDKARQVIVKPELDMSDADLDAMADRLFDQLTQQRDEARSRRERPGGAGAVT